MTDKHSCCYTSTNVL